MEDGFAALFEAHHDAVMRYVVRCVGRDDAPDLVAETFAVLLRSAERPADPLPWLYAVARNLIRNHQSRMVAPTPRPTLVDPADLAVAVRVRLQRARRRLAARLTVAAPVGTELPSVTLDDVFDRRFSLQEVAVSTTGRRSWLPAVALSAALIGLVVWVGDDRPDSLATTPAGSEAVREAEAYAEYMRLFDASPEMVTAVGPEARPGVVGTSQCTTATGRRATLSAR